MKNIKITIFLFILALFSSQMSQAAIPAKALSATTISATAGQSEHHGVFHKVKEMWAHGRAKLDQIVYVILAIVFLGWLAMGINDDFQGYAWLISLILYLLFWLPGVIYSLIMMSKYY